MTGLERQFHRESSSVDRGQDLSEQELMMCRAGRRGAASQAESCRGPDVTSSGGSAGASCAGGSVREGGVWVGSLVV